VPNGIKIELAKRTPQDAAILLAEDAIRTNSFFVITLMPKDSCLARLFAIVESVERATHGGIAPRIRRAVVRICREFGILAAEALDLGGDVASVQVGRNERVDAFRKPFGPFIFDQGGGPGKMGALDVWQLELAGVTEDPVGGELRHGFDFVLSEDRIFCDVFKPAVVGAVVWAKGHPLSVYDDRARPELQTVFAINLGIFVLHEVVSFGNE